MPSPSPIGRFPLLTSPPPALTLPGGRGGEERPQATKGEGGKGSWLLPGAVGVKPLLPQNPQFLVLQLLTGGRPQFPPTLSFHDNCPSPQPLRPHQGKSEGDKRWRRKEWGQLRLPQPSPLVLWEQGPLHSWPLFLASSCPLTAFSDPCLPSPRLILCFLPSALARLPLPLYRVYVRRPPRNHPYLSFLFPFGSLAQASSLPPFHLALSIPSLLPRLAQCGEGQRN